MNPVKRYLSFLLLPFVLLLLQSTTFAQTDQLEPSYEVALHVVIGSNAPGRSELPPGLSAIAKQLKSNFAFENYRLANTFLGRISNTGNIEYKSVSNILGQEAEGEMQTFLEWSMGNFRVMQTGFQARSFRFGARVPIRTGSSRDDKGNPVPIYNYEGVGLTMQMIGLPANKPTLIGTISLPKTAGTIFLVAMVRPAEV